MKKCTEAGKRIQILLSTYNGEKYLREQLDSYLRLEGFEEIKVLIRDDGSTDGTSAILDEYRRQYGFEVVKGTNLGVNKSVYELFRLSDKNCEYYAISDQDDIWLPSKFKIAIEKLGQLDCSKPLLFASCSQIVAEDLKPLGSTLVPHKEIGFFNAVVQNVLPGHTQVFNNVLMKQLLKNYSERILVVDWWIYLIASATGQIVFEDQFTVLHRQHGGNAVGYELNKAKQFSQRIKRLRHNYSNAISLQVKAFYDLYKPEINDEFREEIERYFRCQKTFLWRFSYIRSCKFYRQTYMETIIFKILYLFGKYNLGETNG